MLTSSKRAAWWLIVGIGALSAVNLLGLITALRDIPLYRAVQLPFAPILIPAFSALWALIFGAVAIGMLFGRWWAVRYFAALITGYGLLRLGILAAFAQSDYDRGRLAFQATITALALIPVWWVAWRLNRPFPSTPSAPPEP